MATLTVLKFKTDSGANEALNTLQDLAKQSLITVQDAAIVTWPSGKTKPKTKQLHNLAGLGALDGAFWGMLFGLIFFVPFFGAAIGAAMGALTGSLADVGIDDDFIKSVRDQVTEGTSALFLLSSDAVLDRVREGMKQFDFEIIASNLSSEEEEQLKQYFAE
jgi:uncharacterized membrane protein